MNVIDRSEERKKWSEQSVQAEDTFTMSVASSDVGRIIGMTIIILCRYIVYIYRYVLIRSWRSEDS